MKKSLWMILGLFVVAALGSEPSAGVDVGKLQPVQTVCMSREGETVTVWTDAGDRGTGKDLKTAVEDMKRYASAEIFLDTADHLLIAPECLEVIEEGITIFRPSCSLCLMDGEPDLQKVGQYLQIHAPTVTMARYLAGLHQLKTLKTVDGRMTLVS